MKRLFLYVLWTVALEAQSISITNPASGGTVSGYTYQFQVALTSAPSVARVCYTVDAYPAYNPGIDAPTTLGCSITPGFGYPYNSFWNLNGSHQVVATAYDSLGNVVATSAPVPFTTANNWPVSYTPNMTVATGTPVTSNWAGSVNVTPTFSGSGSADNKTFYFWVDGIGQYNSGGITATSFTFAVDTAQFSNGNHNLCVTAIDATGGTSYTDGSYVGAATEWCRTINFQNGVTASQAITNAHDIYLAPGATFNLTASVLNTDGSTTASSPLFNSSNTAVATVNQSTGVVTAVANGNAQIIAMTPTFTGSNLGVNSCCGFVQVSTTSGPGFTPKMAGWLLQITGGTGWIPGIYTITNVTASGVATLSATAATSGAGAGSFKTGPTRTDWVFVWPTNTMPCFGGNGHIYSSYNASCFAMHEMFSSFGLLTADQPYNPGPLVDFNSNFASGWTFELGAPWTLINGNESPSGMAAWQSSQNSFVAAQEAVVSSYPNIKLYLTGDNFTRSGASLWGTTNGPAGQWTTPVFQITMAAWANYSNVVGIAMQDEVNSSWGGHPLQGPITPGVTTQSWLNNVVATGGSCVANGTFDIGANSGILIHGSATSGMNNAAGSGYTPLTRGTNTLTFGCPSVANGTYGASNDPGLTIEPLSGGMWYGSNTSYITYNAFAQIRSNYLAANPSFGMAWPNAGLTNCSSVANWGGNGAQAIGSIAQVGDYSDMYPANGTSTYLVSRLGANTIVNTVLNLGFTLRSLYGCFNPSLPINALTTGTVIGAGNSGYGVGQGPQVSVASASGNTITFSAPHGITNIMPGITRLYITGATNSGSPQDSANNNFYILNCPTSTTCKVMLSATDFTGTGSGGALNMQDGSTFPISIIAAAGGPQFGSALLSAGYESGQLGGDLITVATPSTTLRQKRGQTFTVTGTSGTDSTNFANGMFVLLPENVNITAPLSYYRYREIPSLSATGGTATIILDNNYVKGRNGSVDLNDLNPGWAFGDDVECMILRCSGERIYKAAPYQSGYSDQTGFTGNSVSTQSVVFADTTLSSGGQLFMNQHFENDSTVPVFHAHNSAALIWNRLAKYILQPALNSPDYGFLMDCGAKAGSFGDVVICLNASDGPQSETFALTPYLRGGQQIIRYVVNDHSITMSLITPGSGSTTDTLVLQPLDAVFYVFPVTFAGEILQPPVDARLADAAGATEIVVRYAYDRYYLDAPAGNTFNCGTGSCIPSWDRKIGSIYYRLIYLGSNSQVLASSDVMML
jgi:Bacterial Ig-like domain (group 2)